MGTILKRKMHKIHAQLPYHMTLVYNQPASMQEMQEIKSLKLQKLEKTRKNIIPCVNLWKRGWKPLRSLETWPKIPWEVFGLREN